LPALLEKPEDADASLIAVRILEGRADKRGIDASFAIAYNGRP